MFFKILFVILIPCRLLFNTFLFIVTNIDMPSHLTVDKLKYTKIRNDLLTDTEEIQ